MEATKLMSLIMKEKMYLRGFSFHVGSPCWDPNAFAKGVKICNKLINTARCMGFTEVNLIDIGGGIPGDDDVLFQKVFCSLTINLTRLIYF